MGWTVERATTKPTSNFKTPFLFCLSLLSNLRLWWVKTEKHYYSDLKRFLSNGGLPLLSSFISFDHCTTFFLHSQKWVLRKTSLTQSVSQISQFQEEPKSQKAQISSYQSSNFRYFIHLLVILLHIIVCSVISRNGYVLVLIDVLGEKFFSWIMWKGYWNFMHISLPNPGMLHSCPLFPSYPNCL